MRHRPFAIVILVGLGLAASSARADTGTYRIQEYLVKLTPRSDGTVEIAYHQKWLVTGGGIPWITVGLPAPSFKVLSEKTAGPVRRIQPQSRGNWSGVRIDLDRNYGPGETFEVAFAVLQRGLLYADKAHYRLDFTPGWYDRAATDHLRIEVFFFAKLDTVAATPEPTQRAGQSLIWERRGLRPDARTRVSVSFPKGLFPAGTKIGPKRAAGGSGGRLVALALVVIVVTVLMVITIVAMVRKIRGGGRYGGGGSIWFGGGRGSGGRGGGVSTGGGGGFGGRAASCACACACVSCACACACAGGGAAGCDRKLQHTCPLCRTCTQADCSLARGAAP